MTSRHFFIGLFLCFLTVSIAGAQQAKLIVDKASPGEAQLSWTGGVPTYEIYRGTDAAALYAPANKLAESSGNSYPVPTFGETPIIFYKVRETGRCHFTSTDTLIIEGDPRRQL